MSPFLSDCPSLMLGIAIHCIQHSQAMLDRGVCELAHFFFHLYLPCFGGQHFPYLKNIDESATSVEKVSYASHHLVLPCFYMLNCHHGNNIK